LVLFSTLVERICLLKSICLLYWTTYISLNIYILKIALHLNEKQISKLDKYINEINNDQTLKHKIEKINLLLTNSSLNQSNGSISFLNDSLNNNNNEAAINPLDIDHEDDDSNLNEQQ